MSLEEDFCTKPPCLNKQRAGIQDDPAVDPILAALCSPSEAHGLQGHALPGGDLLEHSTPNLADYLVALASCVCLPPVDAISTDGSAELQGEFSSQNAGLPVKHLGNSVGEKAGASDDGDSGKFAATLISCLEACNLAGWKCTSSGCGARELSCQLYLNAPHAAVAQLQSLV